jgi:hypothetical protein
MAIQGGITVAHESGLYVGTWGRTSPAGARSAAPIWSSTCIGGYKKSSSTASRSMRPDLVHVSGRRRQHRFRRALCQALGPRSARSIAARRRRLCAEAGSARQWYLDGTGRHGADQPGDRARTTSTSGATSRGHPEARRSPLKAHLGYSNGNPGLGPNGTSVAPTGEYLDWLVGPIVRSGTPLTLGVAYVDTNISEEANRRICCRTSRRRRTVRRSRAARCLLVSRFSRP